jgi:hypothetical protein
MSKCLVPVTLGFGSGEQDFVDLVQGEALVPLLPAATQNTHRGNNIKYTKMNQIIDLQITSTECSYIKTICM